MKIVREHVVDEIIGDVKTNKFKIGEDSMGIIIDSLINLYSDPIGSIVREVTSNCYDAMREKDLKLKHVIPMTAEDQKEWFSPNKTVQIEFQEENILLGIGNAFLFRDYGVGLSKKRVEEIYTLFGNSTKRDNNHQIGGFGIGAKSPFSYTDTFYIITNHNGQKFSYMLYRGNDAFHMDLLKQSETTELNSTEVIIPINQEDSYRDIKNFVKAINSQLTYFQNLEFINIEEGAGRRAELAEISYEDDNVAISLSDGDTELHLMVGRVKYPLNESMVDEQIKWRSNYIPAAIKFAVGEIDLVPSREAIRYTDKTKDAIKTKMLLIQKEMKKLCQDELAKCDNFTTWLTQAHSLTKNDGNRWRTSFTSTFSVQSYLAKLKDKAPSCNLHGKTLSRDFFDDDSRAFQLFRGFSINKVKKEGNTNYVGGYKLSKPNPKIEDFYNLPIYYHVQPDPATGDPRKVFTKTKDFHLANKHPNGFIQIRKEFQLDSNHYDKENNMGFWSSDDHVRTTAEIDSDFEAMSTYIDNIVTECYDSVVPDADLSEDVGTFETEAERRKRLGKAFLRRIYFKDRYNDRDKTAFSNDEYHIHDLEKYVEENKGIVIWGNSKENDLLRSVAALCEQAGLYPDRRGYSSSSLNVEEFPVVILKVAATLNKQMTKFINVKDMFTMKHPILKKWYTAKLTRESVDDVFFYSCFEKLNSDLYYKWRELKENHEENYEQFRYLNRSDEQQMAELCKTSDCVNHRMLQNLKELSDYSKDLDLLKHLSFAQNDGAYEKSIPSKEVFLLLREYLRFKNKAVVKFKKQKKNKVKVLASV